MSEKKVHVYFMPGMAASPLIFQHIKLPPENFQMHFLSWDLPEKQESFSEYAKRMCLRITHELPVLIGVSFGGMLVQEMAKYINVKKLIIISSVKSNKEFPKRLLFAKHTKIHKLLPTSLVNNVELLAKYAFGETVTKRLALYEKYLSVRDKVYIDWAIDQIVQWKQEMPPKGIIHIHGTEDAVFPFTNIKDCIAVKGGTHILIINKYRWLNAELPKIILS